MFHVRIVTPYGLYKEFESSILNVETVDGSRGILSNHVPIVTMLKPSIMNVLEDGTERKYYAVKGGLLYFRDNFAEILVDDIKSKEDLQKESTEDEAQVIEDEVWKEVQQKLMES